MSLCAWMCEHFCHGRKKREKVKIGKLCKSFCWFFSIFLFEAAANSLSVGAKEILIKIGWETTEICSLNLRAHPFAVRQAPATCLAASMKEREKKLKLHGKSLFHFLLCFSFFLCSLTQDTKQSELNLWRIIKWFHFGVFLFNSQVCPPPSNVVNFSKTKYARTIFSLPRKVNWMSSENVRRCRRWVGWDSKGGTVRRGEMKFIFLVISHTWSENEHKLKLGSRGNTTEVRSWKKEQEKKNEQTYLRQQRRQCDSSSRKIELSITRSWRWEAKRDTQGAMKSHKMNNFHHKISKVTLALFMFFSRLSFNLLKTTHHHLNHHLYPHSMSSSTCMLTALALALFSLCREWNNEEKKLNPLKLSMHIVVVLELSSLAMFT